MSMVGIKSSISLVHTQHDQEHIAILASLLAYSSKLRPTTKRSSETAAARNRKVASRAIPLGGLEVENQKPFCPGIPGADKTVLTSVAVNLQFKTRPAYIYFDYQQHQTERTRPSLDERLKSIFLYSMVCAHNSPESTVAAEADPARTQVEL
ncbi:hypothetical protein J3458_004499 [Metarhizium acridum]|uniref:uncharacterized protein n=1 Tax=Metarhizium acridum TaxID=92637 RepID=UPI001C6B74F1|nr:hypothetical protein J3458_004499 [Metarhizium acridum]